MSVTPPTPSMLPGAAGRLATSVLSLVSAAGAGGVQPQPQPQAPFGGLRARTTFSLAEASPPDAAGALSPKQREIHVESLSPDVVAELERAFRTLQEENFASRREHAYRRHYLDVMIHEGLYQQQCRQQSQQWQRVAGPASPARQGGAPRHAVIHPDPDAMSAMIDPNRQRIAELFGALPGSSSSLSPSRGGGDDGDSGQQQQHPVFLRPLMCTVGDVYSVLFRSGAVRVPPETRLQRFIARAVKQHFAEQQPDGAASARRRFRSPAEVPLTLQVVLLVAEQMERASTVASCWLSRTGDPITKKPRHNDGDDGNSSTADAPFALDNATSSSGNTTGLDAPLMGVFSATRRRSQVSIVSDSDDERRQQLRSAADAMIDGDGFGGGAARRATLRGVTTAMMQFRRQLALEKHHNNNDNDNAAAAATLTTTGSGGVASLLARGHQKQQRQLQASATAPKPPAAGTMLAAGRRMHQKQLAQRQQQVPRSDGAASTLHSSIAAAAGGGGSDLCDAERAVLLHKSDSFSFSITQQLSLLKAERSRQHQKQQLKHQQQQQQRRMMGASTTSDSAVSGGGGAADNGALSDSSDEDDSGASDGGDSDSLQSGGWSNPDGDGADAAHTASRGGGGASDAGGPRFRAGMAAYGGGDPSLDVPVFGLSYEEQNDATSSDDVKEKLRDIVRGAVSMLSTQRKHCRDWMLEHGVDSRGKLKTAAVPSVVADASAHHHHRVGGGSFGDLSDEVSSVITSTSSMQHRRPSTSSAATRPPLHVRASTASASAQQQQQQHHHHNNSSGGDDDDENDNDHNNNEDDEDDDEVVGEQPPPQPQQRNSKKSLSFVPGAAGDGAPFGVGGSEQQHDLLKSQTLGSFAIEQLRREASSRSMLDNDKALRPPKIWTRFGPVSSVIQNGSHVQCATLGFYRFVDIELAKDEERSKRHKELFARIARGESVGSSAVSSSRQRASRPQSARAAAAVGDASASTSSVFYDQHGRRHEQKEQGASDDGGGGGRDDVSAAPKRLEWCPGDVHAPPGLSAREAASYERHVSQMRCRPPREVPRDFFLHASGRAVAVRARIAAHTQELAAAKQRHSASATPASSRPTSARSRK